MASRSCSVSHTPRGSPPCRKLGTFEEEKNLSNIKANSRCAQQVEKLWVKSLNILESVIFRKTPRWKALTVTSRNRIKLSQTETQVSDSGSKSALFPLFLSQLLLIQYKMSSYKINLKSKIKKRLVFHGPQDGTQKCVGWFWPKYNWEMGLLIPKSYFCLPI